MPICLIAVQSNCDHKSLQTDLDKLGEWEQKWHMAFHPNKCNILSISRNKNPTTYSYITGNTLKHVDKAKYLGITTQSDLKLHSQVNDKCNKATNTLSFLKSHLNMSSTKLKEQAHKLLVRPSLEYACSIWNPYTVDDIN